MEQPFDINALIQSLMAWFTEEVFVVSTFLQLLIIALTFFIARLLAKPLQGKVEQLPATTFSEQKIKSSLMQLSHSVIWCGALWLSVGITAEIGWSYHVMSTAATLVTAWVVIGFTTGFVKEAALGKTIAIIAWTIAALHILQLLEPTIVLLDKLGVQLGDGRISALSILKAGLVIAFMLWLASALSRFFERKIINVPYLEPSLQVLFSKLIKISFIALAVLIGLGSVGIDMSAFAVFSGAIGLGIGFGLQKVVSNLICGVILLLDRSIKPGDVIALRTDDTFGKVNRLGARCVSVLTRDGQEHLIPNEDFITQKVENWSYTNRNIRLKIPMGISYDSDARKAMELVKVIAEEEERVLKNPEPVVRLTGFGDSCINMELRIWITDPEEGVINVRSSILLKILDAFRENNIHIPFPQRDVHVKSGSLSTAA